MISDEDKIMMETLYWWGIPTLFRCKNDPNPKNCDISLLWHNNYFTDHKYGSFIKEYKKVVEFIYESKIECVTPDVLVKSNYLSW